MPVSQNDVLRATVDGINPGVGSVQNVFHLQLTSATTLPDAEAGDDVGDLLDALYAIIGPSLSTVYAINNYHVVNVTDDSIVGDVPPADINPGTDASNRQPPSISLCISMSTSALRVRGRKFFGPTTVTQVNTNGIVQAAAVTNLDLTGDFMEQVFVGVNGSWQFGIIPSNPLLGTFLPFIGHVVMPVAAIQRRRRFGIGN